MIAITPEVLAAAYAELAPELGVPTRASLPAIRIALEEAHHLADDVYDVPGVLLFALGRTPRCFAGFRAMSVLVVAWHAKMLGFKLDARVDELADVLERVALREMDHDAVRGWTAERLFPFGG